jgi:hypothetical protein
MTHTTAAPTTRRPDGLRAAPTHRWPAAIGATALLTGLS